MKDDQDNFVGSMNVGMTDKGFDYVNLNLFTGGQSYVVNQQCMDFEVGKADTGVWFTADLDGFDSGSGQQVQVGTITLEIDGVTPAREGIWSAKDLGGTQFGSGRWAETIND